MSRETNLHVIFYKVYFNIIGPYLQTTVSWKRKH